MKSAWLVHRANIKPQHLNSSGGGGRERRSDAPSRKPEARTRRDLAETLSRRPSPQPFLALARGAIPSCTLFTSRIEQHEQGYLVKW